MASRKKKAREIDDVEVDFANDARQYLIREAVLLGRAPAGFMKSGEGRRVAGILDEPTADPVVTRQRVAVALVDFRERVGAEKRNGTRKP